MTNLMKRVWKGYVAPMVRRPSARQVAALCYRDRKGKREVLLISSRGTGRWILPKGWHEDGMTAVDAAAREAWEEAGVKKAKIGDEPVGSYGYNKVLDEGLPVPVEAEVFPMKVKQLADEFPEAGERKRKWVEAEKAARMVREPGLKRILRDL